MQIEHFELISYDIVSNPGFDTSQEIFDLLLKEEVRKNRDNIINDILNDNE